MIAGIVCPTAATMPELSGSPTQPRDMFAALLAVLAPVDTALPDAVNLMPEDSVEEEGGELPDLPVSAEELLALVAVAPVPLPLPAPLPILVSTPADQAIVSPRPAPKQREAAPMHEQFVRAVVPGDRAQVDAAEPLSVVQPLPDLLLAKGVPLPPAPPAHSAPPGKGAAAIAPPPPVPMPDEMPGAAPPPMRETALTPARDLAPNPTGRDPALAQIPALQTPAPATPITPASPSPMPVMAQHLAGQIAAALPRLRQSGGEAVLTLDPARLGRVTLSWNPGDSGGSVLTLRAVEPATAALLNRLGEDITNMLRVEPAVTGVGAGAGSTDLRIDIGRADRVVEPRQAELTNLSAQREFAGDAGLSRHPQRAPQHLMDQRPQGFGAGAVNPDDSADAAQPRPDRAGAPARLA